MFKAPRISWWMRFVSGDTYGDVVGFFSIPPNAPTGLTATPGTNLVTLSWTAATGSPNSYNIKTLNH